MIDVDTGIEHGPRGEFCAHCGVEVAPGALEEFFCRRCNFMAPNDRCVDCDRSCEASELNEDGVCRTCTDGEDDGGVGAMLDRARDESKTDEMERGWR